MEITLDNLISKSVELIIAEKISQSLKDMLFQICERLNKCETKVEIQILERDLLQLRERL